MSWTPEEMHCARVLAFHNHRDPLGYPPGGFEEALIRAMEKADERNLGRLLKAFPDFREAVMVLRYQGSDYLSAILEDPDSADRGWVPSMGLLQIIPPTYRPYGDEK